MLKLAFVVPLLAGSAQVAVAAEPPRAPTEFSHDELEFFEQKIRPLLVERCYECHSAEAKKLKGGLRLDSRDGFLKGGDSGPAIVPGKPEKRRTEVLVVSTDQKPAGACGP